MKLLFLFSLLFATGCRVVDQGIPLNRSAAHFMVPGETTYQEIIAELGPPLLYVDGERVVAYRWQTHYGEYHFFTQSGPIHDRHQALALRFDEEGLFQAHTFFSEPDPEKLRQQLEAWAQSPCPSTKP